MVYFSGGQVLFYGLQAAMAEACCDCGCDCSTPNPFPNYCTQCAATDFPTGFATPGDWQVDISGVTVGSSSACGGGCSPNTATHTSFFNRSVTVSPCATSLVYTECIWLCKYFDSTANGDTHLMEMNYLKIDPPSRGAANKWTAQVRMAAWFVSRFFMGRNDTVSADGCNGLSVGFDSIAPSGGSLTAVARSQAAFTLDREAPTYQQYGYDTTDCPPANCAQNTISTIYAGCYPSGWALTGYSPVTSWYNLCRNSLDVTGASVSVVAV